MMFLPKTVVVHAASRLHFGMFSFGQPHMRQYGGVGVMIDRPGLTMRFEPAERLEVTGPHAGRVEAFASLYFKARQNVEPHCCRIEVVSAPPEHTGLGLGTSLGLTVAAGLQTLLERECVEATTLAGYVQRGRRSAVGTYGFEQGGLIVESGKRPGEEVAPLVARVAMPEAWRCVLVRPPAEAGLSGAAEQSAFSALPPVPESVTHELCGEALLHLVPAAREGRFAEFSASVYRFGRLAGECFAAAQGGPYASPRLQTLVEMLRSLGVEGVGQSSWGPTLYAFLPNQNAAQTLVADLKMREATRDCTLEITALRNTGAEIVVVQ